MEKKKRELGGQDRTCLNVPCCKMKFSRAQMCTNDSFPGRLKSDIKAERNVFADTHISSGHHAVSAWRDYKDGYMSPPLCLQCSCCVALAGVPVRVCLCAHVLTRRAEASAHCRDGGARQPACCQSILHRR